jgi:hypothetical protein
LKRQSHHAKSFYKFAKSVSPKKYAEAYKVLDELFEKKESVSDKMIKYAKRKGYLQEDKTINNQDAAEVALYYSSLFKKDLIKTKHMVTKLRES